MRRRLLVNRFRFVASGEVMEEGIDIEFSHGLQGFFRNRDFVSGNKTSLPYVNVKFIEHQNIGKGGHKDWTILPGCVGKLWCFWIVYSDLALEIIPDPAPIKIKSLTCEVSTGVWPERTYYKGRLVSEKMDELMLLRLTYG